MQTHGCYYVCIPETTCISDLGVTFPEKLICLNRSLVFAQTVAKNGWESQLSPFLLQKTKLGHWRGRAHLFALI